MPPTQQQNPYEFITNPQQPKRGPLIGGSKKVRILLVAVLFIFLIIMALVVNSLLSSGDKAQRQKLVEVAQAQSEIVRVSTLARDKAKNSDTKFAAANTRLSVQSSQQDIRAVLDKRGVKGKGLDKELAKSKNAKTDTALDEATKNNRFDETYTSIMNKQLTDYQKLLQAAADGATKSEKEVLANAFQSAGKLTATKN